MLVQTLKTTPFNNQKPGTSGLRKQVKEFSKPRFLENFVQSIFNAVPELSGHILVLGGDGRFFSKVAVDVILRMAAGNGVKRVILAAGGVIPTPAVSHLIRINKAAGGILLTASHNPGGPNGDFGVKYNAADGGSAPSEVMSAIYEETRTVTSYKAADITIDQSLLVQPGIHEIAGFEIEVVDPVSAYADLMEMQFDFPVIRHWLQTHSVLFDAMHGATGPAAIEILGARLGISSQNLLRCNPLEDFGGESPDPNLVHAKKLYDRMMGPDAADFAAASDGDGDRNLIIGKNCYVSPSDSLAVLAANAKLVPAFRAGLKGGARSMPTSSALDRVAEKLGFDCYETPTGWKYFSELLEAGCISICGEESAGTGGDHIREKDGLWAVLFWLNVLSARNAGVEAIIADHFNQFGRTFHRRHDYEALDTDIADKLIKDLEAALPSLVGRLGIISADNYAYTSSVSGTVTQRQGLRIITQTGGRVIYRLSGTGTSGATLRLYLEQFSDAPADYQKNADVMLQPLAQLADEVAGIVVRTGRTAPDVIT